MKTNENLPYFFLGIIPVFLVGIGYYFNLWIGVFVLITLMLISPIDTAIYLGKNILPLLALISGYFLFNTEASFLIYVLVKLFNFIKFEQPKMKEEILQPSLPKVVRKEKESPYKELINQTFFTSIPLKPQGHLIINNQEVPAKTLQGFIDTHSKVKVVDADLRGIIVETSQ